MCVRRLRARRDRVPAGRLGELELGEELQRLEAFARALVPVLAEPTLDPVSATLEFALDGEPWRLTGGFGDLRQPDSSATATTMRAPTITSPAGSSTCS